MRQGTLAVMAVLASSTMAIVSGVQAAGTLYGVGGYSSFGVQSLYAVDATTGAATLIGSTGLRQIAGLDFDQREGRLVALTVGGDQFELSLTDGGASEIVDGDFGVPEGSVAVIDGGAYTTIFDRLHRWENAAWQDVGQSQLAAGADISGLDGTGQELLGLALFGAEADQLVRFDSLTGLATVIGATGTNAASVAGLAHDFIASQWFMSDGSALYQLNTATGSASLIGSHGAIGFSGLAYVPSPGAAVLLGVGLMITARRRR